MQNKFAMIPPPPPPAPHCPQYPPAGGAGKVGPVVNRGHRFVHQRVGLDEGQRLIREGRGRLVHGGWAFTSAAARSGRKRGKKQTN